MNIGSWAYLSKYFIVRATSVTGTNANVQLLPANSSRIAVVFSNAGTGDGYINIVPLPAVNTGIVMHNNTNPVDFNVHDHAALVTQPWYMFGPVGATITAIEVIELPPQEQFGPPLPDNVIPGANA